ncbi:UPF0676 protein C1494.01-like [Stylophora pistillata]|uniref:UPF0676 protein C1494.01-like n=1 Tax=Stylophora pistillata TaxID=50429 RepID=UPI000C04E1C5|nr:UPF0676 protein C1494.01-like [Stylophora pistillata]
MAAVVIDGISVVDFSVLSLEKKNPLTEVSQDIQGLTDQVYYAFSTIGFVYFRNHGITQKMIDSAFKVFDTFFELQFAVKEKYAEKEGTSRNGWDALERESPNPERPGDLKESFDFGSFSEETFVIFF